MGHPVIAMIDITIKEKKENSAVNAIHYAKHA